MSAQRPNLLVVDDDRAILTLIGTIAQTEGFEVSTTLESGEALQLLRRRPADLVLLDLRMPGVTGLEILRAIRDIAPRTPVALMSGYATIDQRRRGGRSSAPWISSPSHSTCSAFASCCPAFATSRPRAARYWSSRASWPNAWNSAE